MEPERPVEKLLRGYAERRRSQAEQVQSLHPNQRQAFLNEVRRQFRSDRPHWRLPSWWPKLAWACGCLLILGLAAAVWLPSALVEKDVPRKNHRLQASRSTLKLTKPVEPSDNVAVSASTTQFAAAEPMTTNLVATADQYGVAVADTDALVAAASAPLEDFSGTRNETSPTVPVPELAPTASAPGDPNVVVQQFSQIPTQPVAEASRVALNRGSTQAVLTAFRVEQNGAELRVVDNDGSVYSGSLEAASLPVTMLTEQRSRFRAAAPTAGSSRAARKVEQQETQASPDEQQYFFRVVGTNRSLNQKVVFAGNLIENTATVTTANVPAQVRQQVPRQMFLNNSRITGRAQIGSQEIQVNAIPAP